MITTIPTAAASSARVLPTPGLPSVLCASGFSWRDGFATAQRTDMRNHRLGGGRPFGIRTRINDNSINPATGVETANAVVPGAYGAAKQAAPPRGVPR